MISDQSDVFVPNTLNDVGRSHAEALSTIRTSELIEQKIYLIRGHKVMLDADLAELYRVTTGNLNLAVRRNLKRFPEDFMFQLSREETQSLLLQNARAKGRGAVARRPCAWLSLIISLHKVSFC